MGRRLVLRDVRRGVAWGAVVGALLSLYAVVLYALEGPAPFRAVGLSLGALVALYPSGAAAAGAVAGLMRPLARRWPGAMLLGATAALPLVTGVLVATEGPFGLADPWPWTKVAILSAVFGSMMGLAVWAGLWYRL